jgi:hypothetical protein
MAGPTGLEPAFSCVTGRRRLQLFHDPTAEAGRLERPSGFPRARPPTGCLAIGLTLPYGAGGGSRSRGLELGKLALYRLSYTRERVMGLEPIWNSLEGCRLTSSARPAFPHQLSPPIRSSPPFVCLPTLLLRPWLTAPWHHPGPLLVRRGQGVRPSSACADLAPDRRLLSRPPWHPADESNVAGKLRRPAWWIRTAGPWRPAEGSSLARKVLETSLPPRAPAKQKGRRNRCSCGLCPYLRVW